jgi:hypothetical protein
LAKLDGLISCILKVQPAATIVYSDLKSAMQAVYFTFPEAKPKHKSVEEAASDTADRFVVIQKHCRLFSVGKNCESYWEKMRSEITHGEYKILSLIKDTIANSVVSTPSKRELKVQFSDASVTSAASLDANGLPSLSFLDKKTGMHADMSFDDEDDKVLFQQAQQLGVQVPPVKAAMKKQLSVLKKPSCIVMKKPASSIKGQASKDDKAKPDDMMIDQSTLKLCGPFTLQSYIVHKSPPKLIVACTKTKSSNFHTILENVFKYLQKTPHATKAMAVSKRDALLSNA